MCTIAISCTLFAIILSKYFKCYILLPISGLIAGGVLLTASPAGRDMLGEALDIAVFLASLQLGYVFGLLSGASRTAGARSKGAPFRLKVK